ncbi:mce related protein [Actinomadura rubteroloni]|uniref:Mce related protein n=1 Tax=Actinomadura rubteroloni TaxID=1926885 RepID=A0A2P4UQR1_9ACTN|nr:MCE family protein [Actinomadura rubteroloni]POM27388.1 mce related protein [Actinomadura rubteroloni]
MTAPTHASPPPRRRQPARMGRRWRLKPVRDRNPIAVAIVGLLLILVVALLALNVRKLPVIGGGTTYTAYFAESAGLRPGNEVRVAGVKVGQVTGVALDHGKVRVSFAVKNTWIGNTSTAAIAIKTLLGDKYVAVDPLGPDKQNPDQTIPLARTTSPYDVTRAFEDLAATTGELDTKQLAASLDALSGAFSNTSPSIRRALDGVSALSKTISSRDAQLARLLAGTSKVSGTLADQNEQFAALLRDGNTLLAEIQRRRDAIHGLLVGTQNLSTQLIGLVDDNQAQLKPSLDALGTVVDLLLRNQKNLDRALKLSGPYTRMIGNSMGNGRWMDGYLCGLVPKNYLPDGTPPKTGCVPPKSGKKG